MAWAEAKQIAAAILDGFERHYRLFREITAEAKRRFEEADWAAVQTARTRSMESATGLLYINVGTIAAGTILAAGLYFGAGLLV